jgi:predicted ATPase/class 3 adenylate cyclase
VSCPSCGRENPGGARFCNECGRALEAAPAHPPAPEPRAYTPQHLTERILTHRSALEGERKQVTVLFADVKGSMELAEAVDPEEWHEILNQFFQILAEGVHRFEGTINQYTGDGIMALFGAPIAHEDHAHRACYSALHIREALREYADGLRRTRGLNFSVRMGLNSGEVIVGKIGDDLRMDYTAQGHTVGLAHRIEQLTPAENAYLSDHTARLVTGFFEVRDLGEFDLKGVRAPIRVWELSGVGPSRTRLDVSEARGFSRFVGREAEMASLDAALSDALRGDGRAVGVVGAAGLGKSRLCLEFVEHCLEQGVSVYKAHSPSHGVTIPFLAVRELLRGLFAIADADSDEDARKKIAGTLVLLGDAAPEQLPYVFDFLGVGDPEDPPPAIDPDTRKRELFEFLRRLVRAKSVRGTSVLLFDDVHWIDSGSDEALTELVDAVRDTRTLLLVNHRPEYEAGWVEAPWVRSLALEPLGREAIEALLDDLLGRDPTLAAVRARIVERAGGNPFFTEEGVQSLVESEALEGARGAYRASRAVEQLEIPASVQPILAARVDRLGDREKRLLQIASVIGKRFREPLLKQIAELSDSDFAGALMTLQDGEFLRVETLFPEVEYAFKNPLTQEVAYDSQLAAVREQIHAAVARAIEQLDKEKLEERSALLAHHWEAAGNALEAARWNLRAVAWLTGNDLESTLRHLEKAHSLAARAPEGAEAARLRMSACVQLVSFSDQTLDDLDEIFEEGLALAVELDDVEAQLSLLVIGAIRAQQLGDFERHEQLIREGQRIAPPGDLRCRFVLGFQAGLSRSKRGDALGALEALDEVADLVDAARQLADDLVARGAYLGYYINRASMLTRVGRLAEAEQVAHAALALSREYRAANWEADSLGISSFIARSRGDVGEAQRAAREMLEVAARIGSPLWTSIATLTSGWVHALAGDWSAAIEALELGLAVAREAGVPIDPEGLALSTLSHAYLEVGDLERARSAADEALACAERKQNREDRIGASLALARLRLHTEGAPARDAVAALLDGVDPLIQETGNYVYAPAVSELRADLARATGDESGRERALEEALHLYTDMKATGHAERIAAQLAREEPS